MEQGRLRDADPTRMHARNGMRRNGVRLAIAALLLSLVACTRLPTGPNDNTWRFLSGRIEQLSFAPFRGGRLCWIYLPPGYSVSEQRYPVLYLNDGGAAFPGGMNLDRACEDLIHRGEIKPLIVVAVTVKQSERFFDYTPWPDPGFNEGGGDAYVRAIRDTLKPEIDRRYRTLTGPENTAMAGWSLGGLISAYAAFGYDSTFGMVGPSSPSYGWTLGEIYRFAESRGRRPLLSRWYQDTGYPNDNYIGRMEALLVSQGFRTGDNLMSVTVEGGNHVGGAWERRFPDMLRFLFKP